MSGERGVGVRVGPAEWSEDADANSSTGPTNVDHGVAIPNESQSKDVHIAFGKTNVVDLEVWAYPQSDPGWVIVDRLQLSEEDNEGQRYEALTAYQRVAVRRVDANVGDVNAFVGLSEH